MKVAEIRFCGQVEQGSFFCLCPYFMNTHWKRPHEGMARRLMLANQEEGPPQKLIILDSRLLLSRYCNLENCISAP